MDTNQFFKTIMITATVFSQNLLTIANSIHLKPYDLRVKRGESGEEIIIKNNFIMKWLLYPFNSKEAHATRLKEILDKNVETARQSTSNEIYTVIQKYNQTVARSHEYKIVSKDALSNRIKLKLIMNPALPEVSPSAIKVRDGEVLPQLVLDKPEIVQERRFLRKYQIQRYPGDRTDHSKHAASIFLSTQKERFLSLIGRIIEVVMNVFGLKISMFHKYHYRMHNEVDSAIYAQKTSPVSLTKEPTSYWMGHASLFLSIPLKSTSGTVASFHVITDPVEGDLNPVLYPRQTKFASPIEEMPAPHVYLLSHNHLDHYSEKTIKKIFAQQPVMIVPLGDRERYAKLAKKLGFTNVNIVELNWWEKKEIEFTKNGETFAMQITATPSRHWSGQGPCGGHESTFVGYVIQGNEGGDIYFAGDTARLNEAHISKLKDHFNIRWNFQPGGPDEVRKHMEGTHQASVDGLWMHVKMMLLKIQAADKEEFLRKARELKTIYMHTMTFKLGNLHVSDTKTSVNRVLTALHNKNVLGLKPYEYQVYRELSLLVSQINLTTEELSRLLRETIIVPKIGSRLHLETPKGDQSSSLYF